MLARSAPAYGLRRRSQVTAAGVDTLLFDELRDSDVVVTNAPSTTPATGWLVSSPISIWRLSADSVITRSGSPISFRKNIKEGRHRSNREISFDFKALTVQAVICSDDVVGSADAQNGAQAAGSETGSANGSLGWLSVAVMVLGGLAGVAVGIGAAYLTASLAEWPIVIVPETHQAVKIRTGEPVAVINRFEPDVPYGQPSQHLPLMGLLAFGA